jgi:chromosomal replication initiation ATPase DnaA
MKTIDEIMQRNREARERILKAGKQYQAQQQQLVEAEAAQVAAAKAAAEEAELARITRSTRSVREMRLEKFPKASHAIRHEVLLILTAHDVYWKEIVSHDRRKNLKLPRADVYRYLRSLDWSYPEIGRFCNRDHSSIFHAIEAGHERRE